MIVQVEANAGSMQCVAETTTRGDESGHSECESAPAITRSELSLCCVSTIVVVGVGGSLVWSGGQQLGYAARCGTSETAVSRRAETAVCLSADTHCPLRSEGAAHDDRDNVYLRHLFTAARYH